MSTAKVSRIHRNMTRTRPQDIRANTGTLPLLSEPASSNDDGGLSDSDPESPIKSYPTDFWRGSHVTTF